jgi:hypothetical protein
MTSFQLSSAIKGYLLRGGVTIGDVIHDDEVVFGPGLNRAYYLESKVAKMPRFVLDNEVINELGNLGDLPVTEEGVTFLDPFRLEYCAYMLETGRPVERSERFPQMEMPDDLRDVLDAWTVMKFVRDSLKDQISVALKDRDYEKVAWLFDRVARELGTPPASSYPRVRWEDPA